ncbi:uncharacterized protein involved in exopolysaccharide biosynthesis [Microlunatus panaciterrae]|uniref:Uncharacterized protein involved in exopolysaccharide biosynthesis n=1 Tax=Microlunatus panaciterrae TaxID=400768 RepID=A0ABS2RIS8_9ACTN|nr:hypothetical protein [Microlunatus panaciterrae]MBM7798914.1 uncharacterized protein involved in exopolysaccharide biosynthesis [Microlunatus panaciterrae]
MTGEHEPNVQRAVRWSLWLALGVFFGILVGFALGLAKPRVRAD